MKDILVVGSLNMDFVLNVQKIPLPGETLITDDYTLIPGGKGANQAYALGKLGTSVGLIGATGNDEYAKIMLENLSSAGVLVSGVKKIDAVHTGNAFIVVDDNGENSIVVASGANGKLTKEMIDESINLLENAKIIIMQLEIPVEVVTYVAKKAKQLGKLVILDPAPARSDLPIELLENVDIIKPNETELRTLSNTSLEKEEDIVLAARELQKKGVKNIIVTLGAKGSILITKDVVKKFEALNVDAVDTTAAGDSFTAGLAKSLIEGKSLDEAIEYGHIVSSIVVTRSGAQSSIPTADEVSNFIEKRDING